uniref:Uncharacterized protein n=1 Tax=Kalanchoe fedtschenkoi TaxID=63787 RepID=A0A7N0TY10_KALFE
MWWPDADREKRSCVTGKEDGVEKGEEELMSRTTDLVASQSQKPELPLRKGVWERAKDHHIVHSNCCTWTFK